MRQIVRLVDMTSISKDIKDKNKDMIDEVINNMIDEVISKYEK